jgi:hypothetical protein
MKTSLAKFHDPKAAIESALRESPPTPEFPPALHNSIMRAVHAARRDEKNHVPQFGIFRHLAEIRWAPVTAVTALLLLGAWLALHNRPDQTVQNSQTLPGISAAFTTGQEVVDALPSATIGPLSDELDKVNQDLNRTAEFLLATLP